MLKRPATTRKKMRCKLLLSTFISGKPALVKYTVKSPFCASPQAPIYLQLYSRATKIFLANNKFLVGQQRHLLQTRNGARKN